MSAALDPFLEFEIRMRRSGLSHAAIRAFEHSYRILQSGDSTCIPESSIVPAREIPSRADLPATGPDAVEPLLEQTVLIKLNGGLGTSMGLDRAKSLLHVRPDCTFLDLILRQVLLLRRGSRKSVAFLLMDSYATSADTRNFLARYPELGGPEDWELMQNRVPKVDAATLLPASFPAEPELEWCPPGHGDLYPSLLGSGWLEHLLDNGVRYAFVSNSDNLGATLDPVLLDHFASSQRPFLMEVTHRTPADRKGGHLARDAATGSLLLRESAQCPPGDQDSFQDIDRHRYFNTNNLWFRLDALRDALATHGGALPLPVIRNEKTLDPRDPSSPLVYQLETAMGAAIACFPGAAAVCVGRERFAPVKTTDDLLVLRSDACTLTENYSLVLHPDRRGSPPSVRLDPASFKTVDQFDAAFAAGVPSLLHCSSLEVNGPVRFAANIAVSGDVRIVNAGKEPAILPSGSYSCQSVELPLH